MFGRDALSKLAGSSSAGRDDGSAAGIPGQAGAGAGAKGGSKLAAIFSAGGGSSTNPASSRKPSKPERQVLRPPASNPPVQYLTPEIIYRHQAARSASYGQAISPGARPRAGGPRPSDAPPRARRNDWPTAVDDAPPQPFDDDVEYERQRILAATGEWGHRHASSLDGTLTGSLPTRTSSRGVTLDRLDTGAPTPQQPRRPDGQGSMTKSGSLPSLLSSSSSAPPSPNSLSSALPARVDSPEPLARPSPTLARPALPSHSSSASSAAWEALLSRTAGMSLPAASPPLLTAVAHSKPPVPLKTQPTLSAQASPSVPEPQVAASSRAAPDTPNHTPRGPNKQTRPARPTAQAADWGNLLSRTSGAAPSSILGPPSFQVPSTVSTVTRTAPTEPAPPVSRAPEHSGSGSGSGGWEALLARTQGASPGTAALTTSSSPSPGARVAALFKSAKPSIARNPSSPDEPATAMPMQTPSLVFDPPAAPALTRPRHRSPSPSSRIPISTPPLQVSSSPPPLPPKSRELPPDRPTPRTRRAAPSRPGSTPSPGMSTPNLLSKRETRPLVQPIAKPSIGITGLVRAPDGERGPRAKAEMLTSPCICCAATLQYPKGIVSFRCTVCGTVTDVHLSDRRAAGLGKSTDPQPLTLARFELLLDEARAAKSPAPSICSARRNSQDEDVADARTLEGDSTDEEEGNGLTSAATLSLYGKSNWFDALEDELFAVFSHWSSLCGSFSNGREPSWSEPGIDVDEVQRFYLLLATLPSELGFAVVRGLEGLLRRPKRRFDMAPAGLAWVLIVLENPALFKPGSASSQSSGSVLKRFLGIVSNLPNEAHHYLVGWLDAFDMDRFERKIELINIALVPRIRKHALSVVAPANRKGDLPSYSHDWRFRSAARVLSLFYASNVHRARLPVSAFYVTFADQLDAVLDYETWIRTAHKKSKSAFFLAQYPFLLSLGAKVKVLVHDSKRQQNEQAGTSYVGLDGRRTVQPFITIRIRRERLIEDSLAQISSSLDHLKRALRIEFTGEEGVDAGGLKKEWFLLLCRELFGTFGVGTGMWVQDEESNLCYFHPASFEADEQYTLVGVIVGLALYHATALDIPLPTAAFKRLLDKPVGLADLALLRPSLAKGLQDLLDFEGDVEETFCRSFVGEYESFGEVVSIPLIPGGDDIPVTASNRQEFVDRLVQFHLVQSVARQFRAFQRGWLSVVEGNALSIFSPDEIELCVRGSPEPLDVAQLRMVTRYDGCSENEPLISAFWEIVENFTLDRQRRLLAFVTGSDRIPAQGLANLEFRIQVTRAPPSHLPSSHTCFNTLALPRYPSRSVLERKLVDAIEESAGFGLK